MKNLFAFLLAVTMTVLLFGQVKTSVQPDLEIKPVLSTPEKSWQALLLVLKTGETEQVKSVTTNNGFDSLIKYISPSQPPNTFDPTFKTWGENWSKLETKWEKIVTDNKNSKSITLRLEATIKEHIFIFKLTDDGWRMDSWSPVE